MAEETDKPPVDSGTLTGEKTPVMNQNGSQEQLANSELIGGRLTRDQLIDLLKKSGLPWARTGRHSYHSSCISEPSSPQKMTSKLRKQNTLGCSSGSSSTTLTSEDQDAERGDSVVELRDSPAAFRKVVPSVVINSEEKDLVEEWEYELPARSGSLFYHESFAPPRQLSKPILFIPSGSGSKTSTMKPADIVPLTKRDKGIFKRLRRSLRVGKTKQKPVIRTFSDRMYTMDGKKWLDSEEELDAVSKPSYFRHIARLVHHGPGSIRVVEIHKPPHGKYGIYLVQGCSDSDGESKSVFISRFYEETLAKFYAGLLSPGDEILAVNSLPVRDKPVQEVQKMFSHAEMVRLTVFPMPLTNSS